MRVESMVDRQSGLLRIELPIPGAFCGEFLPTVNGRKTKQYTFFWLIASLTDTFGCYPRYTNF